jgi:hypothetical protein
LVEKVGTKGQDPELDPDPDDLKKVESGSGQKSSEFAALSKI